MSSVSSATKSPPAREEARQIQKPFSKSIFQRVFTAFSEALKKVVAFICYLLSRVICCSSRKKEPTPVQVLPAPATQPTPTPPVTIVQQAPQQPLPLPPATPTISSSPVTVIPLQAPPSPPPPTAPSLPTESDSKAERWQGRRTLTCQAKPTEKQLNALRGVYTGTIRIPDDVTDRVLRFYAHEFLSLVWAFIDMDPFPDFETIRWWSDGVLKGGMRRVRDGHSNQRFADAFRETQKIRKKQNKGLFSNSFDELRHYADEEGIRAALFKGNNKYTVVLVDGRAPPQRRWYSIELAAGERCSITMDTNESNLKEALANCEVRFYRVSPLPL